MGKFWSSIGMLIIGYIVYTGMDTKTLLMVGKWVGTGFAVLVLIAVLSSYLRRKQVTQEWGEAPKRKGKISTNAVPTPVQPQVVYMQAPNYQYQGPVQRPAGLTDLPIDKYEWEV